MIAKIGWRQYLPKEWLTTSQVLTFFKGGFSVLIAMVVGKAISFIWKLVLARQGADVLGHTQLLLTLIGLVSGLVLLGFPAALTRFSALNYQKKMQASSRQLLAIILKYLVLLSLLVAGVGPILGRWLESTWSIKLTNTPQDFVILYTLPLLVVSELIWAYFNGQRQLGRYSWGKFVLQPFFRLITLVGLLVWGVSANGLVVGHISLAIIASGLISFWIVQLPLLSVVKATRRQLPSGFVAYATPLNLSAVAFMIFGSIDVFLLNQFTSIETIGLYAVLVLLAELMDIFFLPALNILPSFLSQYHQKASAGGLFVLKVMFVLLIGGGSLALILFAAKDLVITWLFGQQYALALSLVGLVLIQKVAESAVVMPLRHYLDFYGYVKQTFILMLVILVVKLALSYFLIGQWGLAGALSALVIVQILHALGCVVVAGYVFRQGWLSQFSQSV
jgi:O-antigen/teichoic acid export membrane protein